MQETSAVKTFLTNLRKSNLLNAEQFADVRAKASQGSSESDVKSLAVRLIKRSRLTRWQAEQLLAGRNSFFLGKYKLLERLGSGSAAAVYKAQRTDDRQIVALKVLRQDVLTDPEVIARFQRETRIASSLKHPHVVAAYEADCVGSTYFLAMELVEGRTMSEWVQQSGPLPITLACQCARQAADGLQYAFERGLVHRDIKPSNLMASRGENGTTLVKILDMGLARFTSRSDSNSQSITQAGAVLGTPDYMAPEQIEDTKSADIRADVYGLGCTLFFTLTGDVPFQGNTLIERLNNRLAGRAVPLAQYRKDASPDLQAILNKMIAVKPADRYQTPKEVIDALGPMAGGGTPDHPEVIVNDPLGSALIEALAAPTLDRDLSTEDLVPDPDEVVDEISQQKPAGFFDSIQRVFDSYWTWVVIGVLVIGSILFAVMR